MGFVGVHIGKGQTDYNQLIIYTYESLHMSKKWVKLCWIMKTQTSFDVCSSLLFWFKRLWFSLSLQGEHCCTLQIVDTVCDILSWRRFFSEMEDHLNWFCYCQKLSTTCCLQSSDMFNTTT